MNSFGKRQFDTVDGSRNKHVMLLRKAAASVIKRLPTGLKAFHLETKTLDPRGVPGLLTKPDHVPSKPDLQLPGRCIVRDLAGHP
jgi:hypothetical protein